VKLTAEVELLQWVVGYRRQQWRRRLSTGRSIMCQANCHGPGVCVYKM